MHHALNIAHLVTLSYWFHKENTL